MAADNGDPITEYAVEQTTARGTAGKTIVYHAGPILRRQEVIDLEPGQEYEFVVRAVNARGLGPAAAAITASTTDADGATAPDEPAEPTVGP